MNGRTSVRPSYLNQHKHYFIWMSTVWGSTQEIASVPHTAAIKYSMPDIVCRMYLFMASLAHCGGPYQASDTGFLHLRSRAHCTRCSQCRSEGLCEPDDERKRLTSAHTILFSRKKIIAPKASIPIEIRLHHRVPYNKLFKTRPHIDTFR